MKNDPLPEGVLLVDPSWRAYIKTHHSRNARITLKKIEAQAKVERSSASVTVFTLLFQSACRRLSLSVYIYTYMI